MDKRETIIVAADIVGYSRLVAQSEESTIMRMRALYDEVISPAITSAGGRVIKNLGDGLLVEANSAAAALAASRQIQENVTKAQATIPTDERIRYRIGINAGSAYFTEDDVFGDVINIAARLESLARPGEICVSQAVYAQLSDDQTTPLLPLGPQFVRNIPVPVEAWRLPSPEKDAAAPEQTGSHTAPTIAVLPFEASFTNEDLRFLGDGLAEELTTQLSRFRFLFVIARNSAFTFRDRQNDLQSVARELGVSYLVTGRVRTAGSRVRVHVDLIDGKTGAQVWADRLDSEIEDLFELQDELTRATLSNVVPELGANERALSLKKPTESLNAWGLCQRGMSEQFKYTDQGVTDAFKLFTEAIEADPKFALPYALLARWHVAQVTTGRSENIPLEIQKGYARATEALQLDDRLEDAHAALGAILGIMGQDVEALKSLDRAEALNGYSPYVFYTRTYVHLFQAQIDCAAMEKAALGAIRVSPKDPIAWAQYFMLGTARWNYDLRNPADGTQDALDQACSYSNCEFFVYMIAAKFHVRFGDITVARRYLERALAKKKDLSLKMWRTFFPFRAWPAMIAETEPELETLVSFGLPRE